MSREAIKPHHFGIVLVPGFSYLALAMVIEPLFIANWIARRKLFDWTRLSGDGLAVMASNGLPMAVESPLGTTQVFDIILILASFEARQAATDSRLLHWLRWAERTGMEIGAVETGSEILAAAGMLKGCITPIHWYNIEGMRERYPEIQVTDTLYNLSFRHPVSAGASATLDMMLALIARLEGQDLAAEVAQHLLLSKRSSDARQGPLVNQGQEVSKPDPVARARQVMLSAIDQPLPCPQIASMVGLSERHLQRLFQQQFGTGMAQIYLMLRMERAHQLVQLTSLRITEIAVACGFSSLEAFSRTYRKTFSVSPSRDRRQSVDSSVFRQSNWKRQS